MTAVEKLKRWREDPVYFVQDQFGVDPDEWQKDALRLFADPKPKRKIALCASAGVGKSSCLAWCALWFLTCFSEPGYHPKGAVMSESWDNLKDNLWAEISHWQKMSPFLTEVFQWTKHRVFHKKHPETWFLSARSWSKSATPDDQGKALSGLHAKFILVLIDESGGIPPIVLKRGLQALTSVSTVWGRIVQAGNPISKDGMLYEAVALMPEDWDTIRITGDPEDPKCSTRIDKVENAKQIKQYGRDDAWVKAYILGQFPDAAINSLLGVEEVQKACDTHYDIDKYQFAQKRLGVDVARFGGDSTVLFPRQGLVAFRPVEMRGARSDEIAARIMSARLKWNQEMDFVDSTGGYGSGVVDSLIQAGQAPIEVNFSSKATDARFFNKRSEIHWLMAEWVKRGGAIPDIAPLKKAMTATTYTLHNGQLRIEEKDIIKKRLNGFSPDHLDALCCTFAYPEMPAALTLPGISLPNRNIVGIDYNPFDDSAMTR